ncbi:hypothetical protein [Streptoalloteichus hindustanus]|uniref:Uncharacterized protein n=1 Tax=Streptoalloteichus hindustanus TaxID=2017 RepID=A0A1M5KH61_STRHI|nr:hypothetical protein [Streptoalloteichus hindustanus]SHG52132.1 hypothetical protein SAMN05444320_109276 [Streptoalloteichus hindustanus]
MRKVDTHSGHEAARPAGPRGGGADPTGGRSRPVRGRPEAPPADPSAPVPAARRPGGRRRPPGGRPAASRECADPPAALASARAAEPEPTGLRSFDLGSVPASVTPPRSWRRAAWLSGAVGGGVAVALLVLGSVLAGPGRVNRIEGLPGYPSEFRFPESRAGTPTPRAGHRPRGPAPARPDPAPSEPEARPGDGAVVLVASPAPSTTGSTSASPDEVVPPAGRGLPTASPTTRTPEPPRGTRPPKATTTPSPTAPIADPDKLRRATVQFYDGIGGGVDGIAHLLADDLRRDGAAVLAQQFGDVVGTRLDEMVIDPARGVTVSVLRVERRDGTVRVERRELRFVDASRPLISGEQLLGGAQR